MIFKDGVIQDLGPSTQRKPINGWRVVNYGQILTQQVAKAKGELRLIEIIGAFLKFSSGSPTFKG